MVVMTATPAFAAGSVGTVGGNEAVGINSINEGQNGGGQKGGGPKGGPKGGGGPGGDASVSGGTKIGGSTGD